MKQKERSTMSWLDEFAGEKKCWSTYRESRKWGYNLTGRTSKKLNKAIDENRSINTKMELTFVPLM